MSDTNVQECKCCQIEADCINGLCELCSDYNYKLQKQADLLTLGLLQEKRKVGDLSGRLNSLSAILLDPDGNGSIKGSKKDNEIITKAFKGIENEPKSKL